MMQRWRSRWRATAAECVSNICAAINKEKASPLIFGAARLSEYAISFYALFYIRDK